MKIEVMGIFCGAFSILFCNEKSAWRFF